MTSESRPIAPIAFHAILAAFFLPFLTAPAAWLAFAATRKSELSPWPRRLLWLAILDTAVMIALALTTAFGLTGALVSATGPRIGVMLASEHDERGLEVTRVLDGTPASRAGLRPGDRIVAIDGERTADAPAMRAQLGDAHEATLTVRRGEEELAIAIRASDEPLSVQRAAYTDTPEWKGARSLGRLAPYAVFLALVIGLWIFGRLRKRSQAIVWIPLVVILFSSSVIGSIALRAACTVTKLADHADLLGFIGGEIAMIVLALAFFRLVRRRIDADAFVKTPPLPTFQAYPLGLFYLVTFTTRVLFLAVPLLWLSNELGLGGTSGMLEEIVGAGAHDRVGAALVGTLAVVLAPVAEELLFRGVVLPHLARSLSPWTAIVVSSVLFGMLHVDHGVLLIGPLSIGIVLGWARWRTGSIGVPILLHTTMNGTAMLLSWAQG